MAIAAAVIINFLNKASSLEQTGAGACRRTHAAETTKAALLLQRIFRMRIWGLPVNW